MVHVCLWQRAPRNGEYAKEKRREENILIEVTNNRRLRLMCCTIEANYWQTRSIAWPLCDSRATCIMSFVYKWTPITEVCFIWLLCVLTFHCRGWGRYFAASQWHCVSCSCNRSQRTAACQNSENWALSSLKMYVVYCLFTAITFHYLWFIYLHVRWWWWWWWQWWWWWWWWMWRLYLKCTR